MFDKRNDAVPRRSTLALGGSVALVAVARLPAGGTCEGVRPSRLARLSGVVAFVVTAESLAPVANGPGLASRFPHSRDPWRAVITDGPSWHRLSAVPGPLTIVGADAL